MDSWCPRCGETISEEPDLPCRRCWDGYCGAELTWRLIERAEGVQGQRSDCLGPRRSVTPVSAQQLSGVLREARSRPDSFGRSRTKRRYERYVRLEAGHDPPAWTWPELAEGQWPADPPGDWNKIGGTPRFLQGVEGPPGEGWKLASSSLPIGPDASSATALSATASRAPTEPPPCH